ncbi:MAG: AAA family ATPase [Verrucomicrobiae bacterium]|nr:AAA family ATPase [Verrucomicrobiae bacterium]
MRITRIELKNWLNFQKLNTGELGDRVFIIGPNAAGKSNLLDALRFLRDVALPAGKKPQGGGLQNAVAELRDGLSKLRCLNARMDTEVRITVWLRSAGNVEWTYDLGFKGEGRANNRIAVSRETVTKGGVKLFSRPDDPDRGDPAQLTQTRLELTNANKDFRELSHFFSETTYLHLVPQLLKYGSRIGGNVIESDPFGQGFLQRIAASHETTRTARLRRIQKALDTVVPQFKDLQFVQDKVTGLPHLEANFTHWRPTGAWQRENQLSDGTLRLIGLLWSLMEGNSTLLLEEPELSLNEEIVRQLPKVIRRIQAQNKTARQVFITTHSEALLSDRSIPPEEVLRLVTTRDGTEIKPLDDQEKIMFASGLNVADVLLPSIKPTNPEQLTLALK